MVERKERGERVDLSELNLDHIDLDDLAGEGPSDFWRYVGLLFLVAIGALVLWFPQSSYYQSYGSLHWVFLLLSGTGVVVGIALGRWLWGWVQAMAARAPQKRRPLEPEAPPSAASRWFTLILVVGGGAAILYGIPSWTGSERSASFDGLWFIAALGGITVGVLLIRWLLIQAASRPPTAPAPRWVPPSWLKWVTLTLILGGAAVALIGSAVSDDDSNVRFALSGVGFAVGVVGAIWLARRFEETETRLREQTRRRRR